MKDHPTEADLSILRARLRGHQQEPLFTLVLVTGLLLPIDLLRLHWQQIDWEKQKILVYDSKCPGRARLISLPEEVTQVLLQHRLRQRENRRKAGPAWEEQDLVFPDHLGRLLCPEHFVHAWQDALQQLGGPDLLFHEVRWLVWHRLREQKREV